jgi:glucosamine-phosphate N-acetyltransferase
MSNLTVTITTDSPVKVKKNKKSENDKKDKHIHDKVVISEYIKKFTIEDIESTEDNVSDVNLTRLLKILDQLSSVKSFEKVDDSKIENLRKHIKASSRSLVNKKYTLVIKYEGVIVGTGSILIENKIIHDLGLVGHIEDIVVDEQYRSLGLAKILMAKLIDLAKEKKCYKIILDAADNVKGFYEKLGFKIHANSMRMNL